MLRAGDRAPDFSLRDADDREVTLAEFAGKRVVLYFYPKDDTPGCTTEACGFRDVYDEILAKEAVVIGVSPDQPESHRRFRQKFELPFHLVSDPDHRVAQAYGAWSEQGIIRSTFIIDRDGTILKVFPQVKPADHASEVISELS